VTLRRWDIAVVGGGVVGLATARLLREAGFDAGVLEQGGEPVMQADDPRLYAIAPSSARALPEAFAEAPERQPYQHMRVWRGQPEQALHFDADLLRIEALGWIVPESRLRADLWQALPPDRRLSGVRLDTRTDHDDGVSLLLSDDSVVRCALVVACDGAGSPLRAAAGIPVHRWRYVQGGLVAPLRTTQPHAETAWQRFCPDGSVVALLPMADGRCSLVWSSPEAEMLQQVPDAQFSARLTDAVQGVLGDITVDGPRQVFPLVAQHAEHYSGHRLVLAGDAAHTVHPLAGQGVNLGIADGAALAAVLAEARQAGRDWWAPRTLARYQRQRQAANRDMIALTDLLSRAFGSDMPTLATVLGAGMGWLNRSPSLKALLMRRAIG
jgi:2-polyprenylphenol 6-hydroxylase